MIITIAVGAGVVSSVTWVTNCASTWFTIWGLFAWIMGAVRIYIMEYFIQCISKIWKSAYFFDNIRHSSTSFDVAQQFSTVVILKEKILYTVFLFIRRIQFYFFDLTALQFRCIVSTVPERITRNVWNGGYL